MVVAGVFLESGKTPGSPIPKVKVNRLTVVTLPLPQGDLGRIHPHLNSHQFVSLFPTGIGDLL